MTKKFNEYLGDGVYASFDGYHVWLATERETGVHRIALEPDVYEALLRYVEQLRQGNTKENEDDGNS